MSHNHTESYLGRLRRVTNATKVGIITENTANNEVGLTNLSYQDIKVTNAIRYIYYFDQ